MIFLLSLLQEFRINETNSMSKKYLILKACVLVMMIFFLDLQQKTGHLDKIYAARLY